MDEAPTTSLRSRKKDVRSRNGCLGCRKRRRKCDEIRPVCGACEKRQITCEYTSRVKWTHPELPGAIFREWTPPPENDEQIQQSSFADGGVHRPLASSGKERQPRFSRSELYDKQNVPFQGIIHMGGAMNYMQETQHNGHAENIERNENGEVQGQKDVEFDGQLTRLVDSDKFRSGEEALAFAIWTNYISDILTVSDSSTTPDRKLASLVFQLPGLLDTLVSLAAEYLSYYDRRVGRPTIHGHPQAVKSFRDTLLHEAWSPFLAANVPRAETDRKQETLAAVLLQVSNAVFRGSDGVGVHLACAMQFVQDLDWVDRVPEASQAQLLVRRFAVFDVAQAILRHRRPQLPPTFWLFRSDASPNDDCPQALLGFFSRLANLAADLEEGSKPEFEILTEASQLETDMRVFERSQYGSSTAPSPTTDPHDTVAQCFYWAAHIMLQRVVFGDAATSPRLQHTVNAVTDRIRSIPVGSGSEYATLFPFYVSSKEAVSPEHREWVRSRLLQMSHVSPAWAIELMAPLLEEIWKLIDEGRGRQDAVAARERDARILTLEAGSGLFIF